MEGQVDAQTQVIQAGIFCLEEEAMTSGAFLKYCSYKMAEMSFSAKGLLTADCVIPALF